MIRNIAKQTKNPVTHTRVHYSTTYAEIGIFKEQGNQDGVFYGGYNKIGYISSKSTLHIFVILCDWAWYKIIV